MCHLRKLIDSIKIVPTLFQTSVDLNTDADSKIGLIYRIIKSKKRRDLQKNYIQISFLQACK